MAYEIIGDKNFALVQAIIFNVIVNLNNDVLENLVINFVKYASIRRGALVTALQIFLLTNRGTSQSPPNLPL